MNFFGIILSFRSEGEFELLGPTRIKRPTRAEIISPHPMVNASNFGQMKHDDALYSIIKDGPADVKVGKEFIAGFFYKTLSTYCLASIEDGGKKRVFFLFILPKANAT